MIFKQFKPDAVIGVGGYSTFPVLRFAQSKAIPTFIHEANSFAGKSNIMLGKKAAIIFTASDGMDRFFPSDKIFVSGNPVRNVIAESKVTKEEAIINFGLSPNKKTVLIIGGSLGSKSINEAIFNNIEYFEKNNLQLIWQTGKLFAEKAQHLCKEMKHISVNPFINKMENAYAAADIVVSRSGAMSIAELCIVKKPVIFVPYPFSAEDHQKVNAQKLVEKNAATIIEDKDVMIDLLPAIVSISNNEEEQNNLKENIGKLAVINADSVIATEIIKYLN
jgi:UDP-N-acetylglucosamine--N-acetylmuramyl-(pentapeptide) pyrophosphoryl-undecaprenol N-acetylglucosamine transferase